MPANSNKIWQGRLGGSSAEEVDVFNSSISFDYVLYEEDITGSIAHARMLGKQQIISKEDEHSIVEGLQGILMDIKNNDLMFDPTAEDIHMFIEAELTDRIGNAGKKLHTGRSRNDQVALDLRMYTKKQIAETKTQLLQFEKVILDKAQDHIHTIMPGYTHLQIAQPVTFAHHILAYGQMISRDINRLDEAAEHTDVMPLGNGALAGTTYPFDRQFVADQLGFEKVTANSLDGVSDRDFVMDTVYALSMIMMHLSRLSEEIIVWSSQEFCFIELDDAFATGSSIMPQKKNPDVAELVRGKAGRAYGNLQTLLTMMKGLPLAYNKDMQEDKEALFDSIQTVKIALSAMIPMIDTMEVKADRMREAASKGFINATDCADYLTKKGVPFREAYGVIGSLVQTCIKKAITLEEVPLETYQSLHSLFEEDIYEAINLDNCVIKRDIEGGPSPKAVIQQMKQLKRQLNTETKSLL
ncbi:argininosuccinate lyase [Marinilactibacillus psychrotolerans]|uniref:Argininosuccinate lyase n=1 Tax=Marinilactibacillus psychrotolerans TaxID=191770 RepID=A0AAV3WXN3_9LACT|nr:argininosuccinate lyase [Marinilactibacillus psychrotolerans]GEL67634.1 argininosuccinate lyase [Marinilactibacillus psychrotolerans]GEQ36504.1 argininosuccinate lyase [Marinilactibacillus psychrotolerans]SDD12828.1 argininosuccinate lyase [Marinilactibacillus psychrotolerans]